MRNKTIKIITIFILFVLTFIFVSCGEEEKDYKITVNDELLSGVTIYVGDSYKVEYTIKDGKVKLESNNDNLTIDGDNITAIKSGNVTVTLFCEESPSESISFDVVVIDRLKDFSVDNEISLFINDTYQIIPDYNKEIEASFTYKVLDNTIASVTNEGLVKGLSKGSTTITIIDEISKIEKTIKINVNKKLSTFTVIDSITLNKGDSFTIDIDYDVSVNTDFEISVNNPNLTIEDNKITALEKGSYEVTVTEKISNISKKIQVTVQNIITDFNVINKIELSDSDEYLLDIEYDETKDVDFIITVTDENIVTADNLLIKAVTTGVTVIKVTEKISNISKDIAVEVYKKLRTFSITKIDTLEVGSTEEIKVVYNTSSKVNFTYNIEGDSVSLNGTILKALKEGSTKLIVTDTISGITKNITVKVNPAIEALLDWAIKEIGTEQIDEVILPSKHPEYDCTYTWDSSDHVLFNPEDGLLDITEFDKKVEVTCTATNSVTSLSKTFEFTIIGYALRGLAEKFEYQVTANRIYKNISFITSYPDYYGGSTIEWSSSNQEIFTNQGVFYKPIEDDKVVTFTYTVTLGEPNVSHTFKSTYPVEGLTMYDVEDDVKEWITRNVGVSGMIGKNTIFPDYIEEYGTTLEWLDSFGNKISFDTTLGNPIFNQGVDVVVKATLKGKSISLQFHYQMVIDELKDKWDAIKLFTDTIASTNLVTYNYVLVSWSDTNKGYLPFYVNEKAPWLVEILPYTYGRQRTNIMKTSTEYIVVHDTGNPGNNANARSHANYLNSLNNASDSSYISWHFTVDHTQAIQHLPLDEVAYHAGDGSHVFGDVYFNEDYQAESIGGGNRNGIGIESCIDLNSDYTETMRILAKLVAELLIQYNLGFDRIKQHNAFSGKNCPMVMRENNRWNEFIYLVQLEYFAKTRLQDVTFEWKSLSPCLNDHGQIITKQEIGTKVNYEVKVTYEGVSKTFTYTSELLSRNK